MDLDVSMDCIKAVSDTNKYLVLSLFNILAPNSKYLFNDTLFCSEMLESMLLIC